MRNYLTSIFAMSIQSGPGNSLKAALRAEIKGRLNCLSNVDINLHSNVVLHSLASLPEFQACKCICIYLSMPSSEIQTFGAIQRSFQMEKRVFIPKVTGKLAEDMIMFELDSIELINSFPRSKWGIPEPPKELIESYEDMTKSGLIDLILVPGVAFDVNCGRIGHGKGYYDSFISRVSAINEAAGNVKPVTVGLAFDEQIVDEVPIEAHDKLLDFVITPSNIYKSPV